jgi:hypothetical protein
MWNSCFRAGGVRPLVFVFGVALCLVSDGRVGASIPTLIRQERPLAGDAPNNPDRPVVLDIRDEPRFVDPAQFLPASLTKKISADFRSASLAELADWLRTEGELTVLIQIAELEDAGISPNDPVSDWLDNQPIYLLLDRLQSINIGWYFEGDILYLTSRDVIERERQLTVPYLLGGLLDSGYSGAQIVNLIESLVEPVSWEINGGRSRINLIGDVIFVRNSDAVQRKVQGFLSAISDHGRQTLINVSAADLALQDLLATGVSVKYADTPLEDAILDLATQTGADLRLDRSALRDLRIRERQPVSLQVRQQPMKTVLNYLLPQLGLGWRIRDGVLWVTSPDKNEDPLTAFYDVRDLCRDSQESQALSEAIQSQMPNVFEDEGGDAVIDFGKPGTLIVWAQRSEHVILLDLLEKYRFALRQSKLRQPSEAADEIKTLYYRLHANVARGLQTELPNLIAPETWQSPDRPDAVGTISLLESPPELTKNEGSTATSSERKVLIIRQRQSIHAEITKTLQRIEFGDPETRAMDGGMGGMGGMGGGFGGGMFSVPETGPK